MTVRKAKILILAVLRIAPYGVPSGQLYAAINARGASLKTFEQAISDLVADCKVRPGYRDREYFITPYGAQSL